MVADSNCPWNGKYYINSSLLTFGINKLFNCTTISHYKKCQEETQQTRTRIFWILALESQFNIYTQITNLRYWRYF